MGMPSPSHSEAKAIEERERRLRDKRQKNDVKIVKDNVFFFGDHEDAMPACSLWVAFQLQHNGSLLMHQT